MSAPVVARGKSRPAFWRRMERERRVAENGDSYMVCEPRTLDVIPNQICQLVAVADGLGGEGNDDLASQTAVQSMAKAFDGQIQLSLPDTLSPDAWLREAYVVANQQVCEERQRRNVDGMYTTLSAALLVTSPEGHVTLYPGNIGDSRIYLWRDGQLHLLTRDDGASGYVTRVIGDPNLFGSKFLRLATTVARTPQQQAEVRAVLEARLRPMLADPTPIELNDFADLFQNVLEGVYPLDLLSTINMETGFLIDRLGTERFFEFLAMLTEAYDEVVTRLAPIPLMPGDRLLLCSDGISNAFSPGFIADAISAQAPNQSMIEVLDNILAYLLETAGRVDDDRTGVLIHIHGAENTEKTVDSAVHALAAEAKAAAENAAE